MNKEDCFNLGHVAKSIGFKGQVSVFIDATNPYEYSKLESVFVEINNVLVPFFIDTISINDKGFAKVKFEGVNDEAYSKSLVKKQMYLPLNLLPKLDGKHFYFHEIVDYKVEDKTKGFIGTIQQVVEVNNNPLLEILFEGKEILIPLQDEFLIDLDRQNKTLKVDCPEGLIDLYLND
jgi:16S rRNA processing protein RimM